MNMLINAFYVVVIYVSLERIRTAIEDVRDEVRRTRIDFLRQEFLDAEEKK